MSDSLLTSNRSKQNPFAGVLPIIVALLLTVVYFRAPQIARNWSVPGHIFFRGLVVLIGLSGAIRVFQTVVRAGPKFPFWFIVSQHRMTIPLEGWVYLGIIIVLFTGAMLTRQNTLLLVFALMAGPFVINGWMTFGMLQAARVRRKSPSRAMQGELFSVEISLRNSRPWFAIWMMSVRDEIVHQVESLSASVLFSRVSSRTSQSGQYQLRLANRGRYQFGPLRAASRFPLGLVERSRVFSSPAEILIYPRIGRVSRSWRQRLGSATELNSRKAPNQGLFQDDFNQLREFRSGDNPRAIHWRSTARRGQLILREFHQNREHILAIILDLFGNSAQRNVSRELDDFALSFVASLLIERGRECRDGYLSLTACGETLFQWEGQGTSSSLESLFDGLATFESGPSKSIGEILKSTLLQTPMSTQILLVTTRRGPLSFQNQLTSRVNLLNLNEVNHRELLAFDDDRPAAASRSGSSVGV